MKRILCFGGLPGLPKSPESYRIPFDLQSIAGLNDATLGPSCMDDDAGRGSCRLAP